MSQVPESTAVLGLHWDIKDDMINIKPPAFVDHSSLSKRKLLSLVSSVFDPLGLLTPITIKSKLLLREAWMLKIGWDEALPPSFSERLIFLREEYQN